MLWISAGKRSNSTDRFRSSRDPSKLSVVSVFLQKKNRKRVLLDVFYNFTLLINVTLNACKPVSVADDTLSSVGASLVERQNVIFVGTASGRLHALLVEGKHSSRTFHQVLLERGVRILPQIFVHDTAASEKYLIVASLYKVRALSSWPVFFCINLKCTKHKASPLCETGSMYEIIIIYVIR